MNIATETNGELDTSICLFHQDNGTVGDCVGSHPDWRGHEFHEPTQSCCGFCNDCPSCLCEPADLSVGWPGKDVHEYPCGHWVEGVHEEDV